VHVINSNQTLTFAVFVKEYTWLTLTWLACQAAADLVICCAMVLLLRARRTGFEKYVDPSCRSLLASYSHILMNCVNLCFLSTDTVLNIMTLWTINTGVVTALLSMIILIAVGIKRPFSCHVLKRGGGSDVFGYAADSRLIL